MLLGHDVGAGSEVVKLDLPVCRRGIKPVGRNIAAVVIGIRAIGSDDAEHRATKGRARKAVALLDNQPALRGVAKFQRDRLPRLDVRRLRSIVQHIAVLCNRFFCDQRRAGGDAVNEDRAGAVGGKIAVAVPDYRAGAVRYEKLHVGDRRVVGAVDLLNQQGAFRRVAEIKLHDALRLAADIGRLRRGVDHMVAVAGKFLHHIRPSFEASDGKAAVGACEISADDRAARAAGAGQILDLEHGIFDRFAGHAVVLENNERGKGRVLKGDGLALAREDIKLLRGGVFDGVARGRLQLRHLVPAVL